MKILYRKHEQAAPQRPRALVLNMLCESQSMRATARLADVSFNTVAKLLVDAGKNCADLYDEMVQGVTASRIQCDEIWSFTYAKQKNVPMTLTVWQLSQEHCRLGTETGRGLPR